jgi:thiamine-monophosphate kinase
MNDEHALVERLRARFATDDPAVRVGIGDDAAVVRFSGDAVLTVDVSVEDVHFRRAFAPLDVIAERAFHAAASDIAAMAARPTCALISLVLPEGFAEDELDALLRGLARASSALGTPIVGGNTSRGPSIAISTTVMGTATAPLLRSGARVGDRLYVTGATGDRALGLEVLLRDATATIAPELREAASAFANAWRTPRARIAEGLALSGIATSAIDLSDGLAKDLHRVVEASGVRARVFADALPFGPSFDASAHALGLDATTIALEGGEAYELLFTMPADATLPFAAIAIGEIVAGAGVVVVEGGVERVIGPRGFDHLRSTSGSKPVQSSHLADLPTSKRRKGCRD